MAQEDDKVSSTIEAAAGGGLDSVSDAPQADENEDERYVIVGAIKRVTRVTSALEVLAPPRDIASSSDSTTYSTRPKMRQELKIMKPKRGRTRKRPGRMSDITL